MSAHTPGPWEIIEKTDAKMISSWSIRIGDDSISFFPYKYHFADEEKTCGGYGSDPEKHANARLIAAAPDLLEALRPFAKFACSPAGQCDCHNCRARAAIAKANALKGTP